MKIEEVIAHFGNMYQVTKETGLRNSNYYHWLKKGFIPIGAQRRIEYATGGKLLASLNDVPLSTRIRKNIVNMRNLLKLLSCDVTKTEPVNYDNPYVNRINIIYGPNEMPFHDSLHLTHEELIAMKCGLSRLMVAIDEFTNRVE